MSGESESQPTLLVTGDALLKLTVSLFSPSALVHALPTTTTMYRNRVCNVPIEPGADWRSLPEELWIATATASGRDVRYSRLDGNRHFRTAMTTVTPTASGSTVIHPTVCPYLALYMPEGTNWASVADSKREYSPSVSVLAPRVSRTTGSSCPIANDRVLSCAT